MNVLRAVVLLFMLALAASFAGETNTLPSTITVGGTTYSNVTWRTVTPATVSIFHQTGVASIPLEKLPPELQKRFGYDPQKAADYRAVEAVQLQRAAKEAAERRAKEQAEIDEGLQKLSALGTPYQQKQVPQTEKAEESAFDFFKIEFSDVTDSHELKEGWYKATLWYAAAGKVPSSTVVIFSEAGLSFLDRYMSDSRRVATQDTYIFGVPVNHQSTEYVSYFGLAYGRWLSPQEVSGYGLDSQQKVALLVGNNSTREMGGRVVYHW